MLTRVGDFEFKADSYLTDSRGNVVYGFMCVGEETDPKTGKTKPIISDQLVPIRKPRWEKNEDGSYTIHYPRTDIDPNKDAPVEGDAAGGTAQKLVDDKPKYHAENNGAAGDADDTTPDAEYEFAQMDSISISANGCITGVSKADGKLITIGYLAIGSVDNPNGVTHVGKSYYQCMEGAGDLHVSMLGGVQKDLGISQVNGSMMKQPEDAGDDTEVAYKSGTDILGTDTEMMVGFLESGNVDLAEEIAELITTQRGYQANTRIITVTDSMLEELVNMKR